MKLLTFIIAGFICIGFAGFLSCIFSFKPDFGYIEQTLASQPDIRDTILWSSVRTSSIFALPNAFIGLFYGALLFFIHSKIGNVYGYKLIFIILIIVGTIIGTYYAATILSSINPAIGMIEALPWQLYMVSIGIHIIGSIGAYFLPLNIQNEQDTEIA